jgi:hypothetical protein
MRLFDRKASKILTKPPDNLGLTRKYLSVIKKPQGQGDSDSSSDDDLKRDIFASPLLKKKRKPSKKVELDKIQLNGLPNAPSSPKSPKNFGLEFEINGERISGRSPSVKRKTLLNKMISIMRRNSTEDEAIVEGVKKLGEFTEIEDREKRIAELGQDVLIPFLSSKIPQQYFIELVVMDSLDENFYYKDDYPFLGPRKTMLLYMR